MQSVVIQFTDNKPLRSHRSMVKNFDDLITWLRNNDNSPFEIYLTEGSAEMEIIYKSTIKMSILYK